MEPVRNGPTAKGIASWSEYRENLLWERDNFERWNRAGLRVKSRQRATTRFHKQRQAEMGLNDSQYEGFSRTEGKQNKTPFEKFWLSNINQRGYVDGSNLAYKLNDEFGDDEEKANEYFEKHANDDITKPIQQPQFYGMTQGEDYDESGEVDAWTQAGNNVAYWNNYKNQSED